MLEPVPYTLIRSARKTISIQVATDGTVTVRAPRVCGAETIEEFVKEKSGWIRAKQKEFRLRRQQQEERMEGQTPWNEADYQKARLLARQVFVQKTALYARLMGVTYGQITVRDQKTRWGSCSARGNLNFNWRLILAPEEILDYVVVHELAHRREMNHSPRFWAVVESVMPEYRKYRLWLKRNGESLMVRREPDGKERT